MLFVVKTAAGGPGGALRLRARVLRGVLGGGQHRETRLQGNTHATATVTEGHVRWSTEHFSLFITFIILVRCYLIQC